MDMDLTTVGISLGTFAIAAAVLFFISFFGFKERTYEEVIAEQRKNAGLAMTKPEKTNKDKDKKSKKSGKKTKEKEKGTPSTSEQDEEKPHVEFELTEEIIPEEPVVPVKEEKEKKKSEKKEKIKPILRNKDEVSPVPPEALTAELSFDPDVNSANHFAENPPKDVIELKLKEDKKNKTKAKTAPEPEAPVVEPPMVKEVAFTVGANGAAPAAQAQQQQQQQQGTPKKQQRKKKVDSVESVDGGEELLMLVGGSDRLMSALQKVPLSPTELQTLIEVLLNRQQEAGASESEWYEKGGKLDPVRSMKKQLTELEKQLKEEQDAAAGYQNKLRTLTAEMQAERTRALQGRKQLEDALARQTGEMQVLTSRLQQIGEQHAAETAALHSSIQQLTKTKMSEDHLIQRLQDEKTQLEVRCAGAQQLQQELGNRIQQLEDVLRQRMEEEVTIKANIQRLHSQLQEAEQTKGALLGELAQNRDALHATESKSHLAVREAHARLEEFERNKQHLESRLQAAETELSNERNRTSRQQKEAVDEISRLRQENQDLASKLNSVQQNLHQEQEKELQRVKEELAQKDQQLRNQIAALELVKEQLSQKESLQQEERGEVESLRAKVAQAEAELEAQKKKNNELRERNWKAMEAVSAAEKSVVELKKAKSGPSPVETYQQLVSVIQRVLPQVSVDAAVEAKSFEQQLEGQLKEALASWQKEEEKKSQGQVQHYKTVLSQTEVLLNRLQSRVEAEETAWKDRLSQVESRLGSVTQERDFWMQQCQQQEAQQQQQQQQTPQVELRLESLEKEKQDAIKEAEKQRRAAEELSSELHKNQTLLKAVQAALEEEKHSVNLLKEQLEQSKGDVVTKAEVPVANGNSAGATEDKAASAAS